VYGGGGVMPDVFIPIDSTRFSEYYTDLVRKGVFNQFTMNYLDVNRNKILNSYPDVITFQEGFIVDDEMYDSFEAFAVEEGVERNEDDKYYYPDENIKIQIKALLARNLWDVNAYFILINQLDDELHEAVEILNDGKLFSELNLD
jgi:carboxyl-terminal processing protease